MANFDPKDLQQNQKLGALGYLEVLFFIPLILRPNSRFVRHCANQGLLMLIAAFAIFILQTVLGWLPFIGSVLVWVLKLGNFALGLVAIYFAYLAFTKGEARELPYVGHIKLIR